MTLEELEQAALSLVQPFDDVTVTSCLDDGVLRVDLLGGAPPRAREHDVPRHRVRLATTAEVFRLTLDDLYRCTDFGYDDGDQRELLEALTLLAVAYLRGEGHVHRRKGRLGRVIEEFVIHLDCDSYRISRCRRRARRPT